MKDDDKPWLTAMQALALKIMEDQKRANNERLDEAIEMMADVKEQVRLSFKILEDKMEEANKALTGLAKLVAFLASDDGTSTVVDDDTGEIRDLCFDDLVIMGGGNSVVNGPGRSDGQPSSGSGGPRRRDGVVGAESASGSPERP